MRTFGSLDKDHLFFFAASLEEVLESAELVEMLGELGLPYDRVVELFESADLDGDGTVSFDEFMDMFKQQEEIDQNDGATKMQAAFRGRQARAEAQKMKDEKENNYD